MRAGLVRDVTATPATSESGAVDQAAIHPKIARMWAYWESLIEPPLTIPRRAAFEPGDVPDLLSNLWILDVVREGDAPPRFRMRLIGERIREAGITARPGDFMDAPHITSIPEAVLAVLARVAQTALPDYAIGPPLINHDRNITKLERVMLPFTLDDGQVDQIFGCTVFHWRLSAAR